MIITKEKLFLMKEVKRGSCEFFKKRGGSPL